MPLYFLDTSAFLAAYMADEDRHDDALEIYDGRDAVVASELVRVEAARAVRGAEQSGRLRTEQAAEALGYIEDDTGPHGVVGLIGFDGPATLERARELVLEHPLYTLDALHLAVADREGRALAGEEELIFVTHDARQRDAARALGLAVL